MATKKKNGHTPPTEEPRLPVPVPRPKSRARAAETPATPSPAPRARRGAVERRIPETEVSVALDLDGEGRAHVHTPLAYLDGLLELLAKHALFDVRVDASGDVDAHAYAIVESIGYCLGRALLEAVGDRAGLVRLGERTAPSADARVRCAVDLGDRPAIAVEGAPLTGHVGSFDAALVPVLLQAIALEGRLALHVVVERAGHPHTTLEALFTALGRALEQATLVDARRAAARPA